MRKPSTWSVQALPTPLRCPRLSLDRATAQVTATETKNGATSNFEIAAGPQGQPGLGFFRTSSSPGHPIEVTEEVHDGDVVLVPHGWHGPAMAPAGYDLYYLNVMAGPGAERAWLICDDPAHGWVRDTWADEPLDPRLPLHAPAGAAGAGSTGS